MMQVNSHFTLLVYAFRHAVSDTERNARLQKLNDHWQPWWRRLDDKALKRTLDDTYFFLPYVRAMLFPETRHLPTGEASQQLEGARGLAGLSAEGLAGQLDPDGVVRLTHDPEQLEALHPLQFEFERKDAQGKIVESFRAAIRVCWVDIALFPQKIGFLIVKVELDEQGERSVNRINDLLYYCARCMRPQLAGNWPTGDAPSWKRRSHSRAEIWSITCYRA